MELRPVQPVYGSVAAPAVATQAQPARPQSLHATVKHSEFCVDPGGTDGKQKPRRGARRNWVSARARCATSWRVCVKRLTPRALPPDPSRTEQGHTP
jgi:hypothetical protein